MSALSDLFAGIAAAIREKTGETGTMKPAQFPEKIAGISTAPGASYTFKSGSVKGNGGILTVEHNMGQVPDVIIIALCTISEGGATVAYAIGYSEAMMAALGGGYFKNIVVATNASVSVTHGIETTSANADKFGCIRNATATTFDVGGKDCVMTEGDTYDWYAIGGII